MTNSMRMMRLTTAKNPPDLDQYRTRNQTILLLHLHVEHVDLQKVVLLQAAVQTQRNANNSEQG